MIDTIVQITQRVIGDGAIETFLPTLIDFDTRTVSVLEGLPAEADTRTAVRDWLAGRNLEAYGLAFRSGSVILITASRGSHREFVTLARHNGVWVISPATDPL